MTPRLSIIIPAYNAEKTLEKCVKSVVATAGQEVEIILVDDGSTDSTPGICDRLANDNSCVSVIHQANKGLSGARNAGLETAKGHYVTFLDADDWICLATIPKLLHILSAHPEYDILEYSMKKTWENGKTEALEWRQGLYTSLADYWLFAEGYSHSYACNKIFKRKLFDGLRFPEGVVFEDVYTIPHLMKRAETIAVTPEGSYMYFQNQQGITHQASAKQWYMLLAHHLKMWEELQKQGVSGKAYATAMSKYYMHLVNIQLYYSALSGAENELKEYPAKWEGCTSWQSGIKLLLLKAMGIKRLCRLYACIYHKQTR
ncbi:MAG: glycosyltransferase family 2 protein [Prevotella sp.]|nr:glycosyltransferase family 2 protein [Prevotella sp.]